MMDGEMLTEFESLELLSQVMKIFLACCAMVLFFKLYQKIHHLDKDIRLLIKAMEDGRK
jgi:hypothetical protein